MTSTATARIVQVSPTETLTYDMPCWLYGLMVDVFDSWVLYHSRRDKPTVEKVLGLFEAVGMSGMRDHVVTERRPTKPELKGLCADIVWYDPYGYSKEEV